MTHSIGLLSKIMSMGTAVASQCIRNLGICGESHKRFDRMTDSMGANSITANLSAYAAPCARLAGIGAMALAVAACGMSQITEPLQRGLFGGDKPQTETVEQQQEEAPVTPAALASAQSGQGEGAIGTSLSTAAMGCPTFDIESTGRSITFSAPGGGNDPQSVMHRGEIQQVARECDTSASGVAVKYGFSGRVLLGPRGKSGSITLPAKVTIVDRTNVVLQTQKIRVVVNVPAGETAGAFSEVKEVDLPIPAGVSAKNYRIYVGFDPEASAG